MVLIKPTKLPLDPYGWWVAGYEHWDSPPYDPPTYLHVFFYALVTDPFMPAGAVIWCEDEDSAELACRIMFASTQIWQPSCAWCTAFSRRPRLPRWQSLEGARMPRFTSSDPFPWKPWPEPIYGGRY